MVRIGTVVLVAQSKLKNPFTFLPVMPLARLPPPSMSSLPGPGPATKAFRSAPRVTELALPPSLIVSSPPSKF